MGNSRRPGQAGTKLADFYAATFAEVRKNRDIVLFDQRGTGKSNGLKCDMGNSSDLLPIEKVKECKSQSGKIGRSITIHNFEWDA